MPLQQLKALCRYWAEQYDWRATERRLNKIPQFRTEIDGLPIHFLHVRSSDPTATPLVLTHGWPGSFLEFEQTLAQLAEPKAHGGTAQDAFHVVVPSLPGYAFSGQPTTTGWNIHRIARSLRPIATRNAHHSKIWTNGPGMAPVTPPCTAPGRRCSATR